MMRKGYAAASRGKIVTERKEEEKNIDESRRKETRG